MREAALALLLVLALSVTASAAAFRDLNWGDPVSKLGESTFVVEQDGIKDYLRKNDVTALGDLRVTAIVYGFFENKLITVSFSSPDASGLMKALKAKYGVPDNAVNSQYELRWTSDETIASLKLDESALAGQAFLISTAVATEYQKWQRDKAAKNAAAW